MIHAKFINKYGYSKTMDLDSAEIEMILPFLGKPVLSMINDNQFEWESKEVPAVNFYLYFITDVGNIKFAIYRETQ